MKVTVYDAHKEGLSLRGIELEDEESWSEYCNCYCGISAYKDIECLCCTALCGHLQLRRATFRDVDCTRGFYFYK